MYLCETSFPALGCDDVSIAPIVRPNLILYQTRARRYTAESKPLTSAMLTTSWRCEFTNTKKVFDQSQQSGRANQSPIAYRATREEGLKAT